MHTRIDNSRAVPSRGDQTFTMSSSRTPATLVRPPRARRAFSLLELTLVLLILGVLTAVAAVSLGGFSSRAKVRATRVTMDVVRNALETYKTEKNTYPPSLETLVSAKYLDETKKPMDGWDQRFRYQVPGRNGKPFDLLSVGEDGQVGTEDDLDVWDPTKS
ncbi:MAG: type II secretion system protein GspG [Planctomycetota bacterium]|nr:type II secretion system protein GspG [Planctomycetota bacterium]